MKHIGETLRELRENGQLPLETVAAYLKIDQTELSRIECDEQKPSRKQIIKLAKYFDVNKENLLNIAIADALYGILKDEKKVDTAMDITKRYLEEYKRNK
jgi:transcriptional regulator with XRE-family HTH domain